MFPVFIWFVIVAIAIVTFTFGVPGTLLRRQRRKQLRGDTFPVRDVSAERLPPCIRGWCPYVRAGFQFAFGAAPPQSFLEAARKQHGDVFTVEMFGRRMTFLFSKNGIGQFFDSAPSKVSFIRAVEPFTDGIFGLAPTYFEKILHMLLVQLREELHLDKGSDRGLVRHLTGFAEALRMAMRQQMASLDGQAVAHVDDLFDLCGRLIFTASFQTVFGRECANALNKDGRLYETFVAFDREFELAALPIPQFLLRSFSRARRQLLRAMQRAVRLVEPATPAGKLLAKLDSDEKVCASVLLTLLWASSANTLLSAGWLIVLSAEWCNRARPVTESMAWELVTETLRLASSGIAVRIGCEPLYVDDFRIPAGDYLCISPWLAHQDEHRGGKRFDPCRYQHIEDKKALFRGRTRQLYTFGGGMYRCPGQEYALHELVLFIQIFFEFVERVELEVAGDPLTSMDAYRLVGIKRPTRPFPGKLFLISSCCDLRCGDPHPSERW
jgi:cytochrome P450